MLDVCKCMCAYSMHESQSREIRPYVTERQTVHADYMPAEFLFHQKSPNNRDNRIYIHVGKSTLETCKKHVIFSQRTAWIAAMLLQGITHLYHGTLQPHCVLQLLFSTIPLLSPLEWQSRKRSHLRGLLAAGGILCSDTVGPHPWL